MLYTYTISKNFINEINKICSVEEALNVYDFVKDCFISRENMYFCGTNKAWGNYYNQNCPNNALIKLLSGSLNNEIGPLSGKLKNKVDYFLSGIEEENEGEQTKITCENIIYEPEKLKKEILNDTKDSWKGITVSDKKLNQQKKRQLKLYLNKIFNISDQIYLVDRHIPRTAFQNESKYILSYKNSFEFIASLKPKKNSKLSLYNGIDSETKKGVNKEDLKKALLDLYQPLNPLQIKVYIKDDHEAYGELYLRGIISVIGDTVINIFQVDRGLNLIKNDINFSIDARTLKRLSNSASDPIWESWQKNVENARDYLSFSVGA